MKKSLILYLILLLMQSDTVSCSQEILQAKITAHQEFLSLNFQDIVSVQQSINAMYQLDQQIRQEYSKDRHNSELIDLMHSMDQLHTNIMKIILAVHGWLTISQFGTQIDSQAWLLVQHADHDLPFQEECLLKLEKLIDIHETDKKNYAYLYDRVAVKSESMGYQQKYGTQCSVSETQELSLQPYQGTLEEMNHYRAQMGLAPIEEYLERMSKILKSKI